HTVRAPTANQLRVYIFDNIKTLDLCHIKIVNKPNLSTRVFRNSSYDGFYYLFFHHYAFRVVFSICKYLRITHVFIIRYSMLNTPNSTSANIHCVVMSWSAKWITASPMRNWTAPYKKEISNLLTAASLPRNW